MEKILTDDNFDRELAGADRPVLVDFFATWCEPCSVLAPILDEVAEELKDKIVLMRANLDDVPLAAGKFKVEKIPTVILFKKGQPIAGFVGLASKEAIKEFVKNSAKGNTAANQNIEDMIECYDNYAKSQGFRLNPNRATVERVMKGLLVNEAKYGKRYCPCRRVSGNAEEDAKKICPCAFHKDEIAKDGHCFCNLFVK